MLLANLSRLGDMSADEFRKTIHILGKSLPEWAVRIAADWYVRNSLHQLGKRSDCLELARRIAEESSRSQEAPASFETETSVPPLPETPFSRLTADRAVRLIEPVVCELRRRLFGEPTSPFRTQKQAVNWVEIEHSEDQKRLADRAVKEDDEWADDIVHEGSGWHVLRYARAGKDTRSLTVRWDSRLGAIAFVARRLAVVTGFTEPEVVGYILGNAEPAAAPVRVTRNRYWVDLGSLLQDRRPRPFERRQVVLEINTPDLNLADLRNVYQDIRRHWGKESSRGKARRWAKNIAPDDERLVVLMKRLGFVDVHSLSKKDWQRVARTWEKSYHSDKSWDALRKRWERLQDKLPTLGPIRASV